MTIYLSGRGNVDTFRLRTGVNVSASDLALMLTGFAPGVTRVVILDSCFGGSFADDLEATGSPNEIVVIGTSTTCPFDAPFDGLIQTFAEDLVEQAGQGLADTNHDGVVTGGELKTALPGLGWKLGEAGPFDAIMNGKSKCDGVCDLPMITAAPPQCAAVIAIDGSGFAASSNVALDVLNSTLTAVQHGNTVSDVGGGFTTTIAVPVRPSLVVAEDAAGNLDWHFCVSGPTPVPVDDAAPSCSLVLVGNVIKGTFQDLQSGLADIDVTSAWNVSVIIGPFTVGTTAPVMSEATIVNPMRRARVGYRLTDVAGHFTTCSKSVLRRTFSFSR